MTLDRLKTSRSINQQLLDERDLQRDSPVSEKIDRRIVKISILLLQSQDDETSSSSRRYIQTQGSILSNYFSSTTHR